MNRTAILVGVLLTTAATAQAETVQVNGMQMYYEVSGEGDPLVVLHGAYMGIPDMGEIIPMLAETHQRLCASRCRAMAGRTTSTGPITYPNLADDVAAFMDAVGSARGRRLRLLHGRGGGTPARHPAPREGGPARPGLGRLRR